MMSAEPGTPQVHGCPGRALTRPCPPPRPSLRTSHCSAAALTFQTPRVPAPPGNGLPGTQHSRPPRRGPLPGRRPIWGPPHSTSLLRLLRSADRALCSLRSGPWASGLGGTGSRQPVAGFPLHHLSVPPSCFLGSSLQGWGPYTPSQGWASAHGCSGLGAEGTLATTARRPWAPGPSFLLPVCHRPPSSLGVASAGPPRMQAWIQPQAAGRLNTSHPGTAGLHPGVPRPGLKGSRDAEAFPIKDVAGKQPTG